MQKGSGGLLASTAASWYNKQKGYWKEVRPVFSECERVNYAKAQLAEVICQLRFPTILRIGASEPAEFQERIREDYPRYSRNVEKQPPKLTQTPQGVRPDPQPDIVNYQFLSGDGRWKVNLTSGFVSLATPAYSGWTRYWRTASRSIIRRFSSASACGISTSSPAVRWGWRRFPSASCSSPPLWGFWARRMCARAPSSEPLRMWKCFWPAAAA